jgi:hypothetical protein
MKAARASRVREARVPGTVARAKPHGARITRETRVRQRAVSPARVRAAGRPRHDVHRTHATALRQARPTARRDAVHRTRVHREAARSAPAQRVSRRVEHAPGVLARPAHVSRQEVRHERAAPPHPERHAAMSSPRAARAPAPQASAPRMHGNPHGAPPAQAAQRHAQPPPQSAAQPPKGKEKKERG